MLQNYLEALGHDAKATFDGASALALLDTFAADVLLVDIGMPSMSGYDLAKLVRQRADGARIKIVALSGYARDLKQEQRVPQGFAAHLHKPVDLRALAVLLEN